LAPAFELQARNRRTNLRAADDGHRLAKQAQIDDLLKILEFAGDDSPNDWVDRQGKDGQTGRVVNRDNIRRAKLRIAA
jgi:hypothetical protein